MEKLDKFMKKLLVEYQDREDSPEYFKLLKRYFEIEESLE